MRKWNQKNLQRVLFAGEKEEVPEPVVDEVVVEIDEETGTETLALNHIAKITKSAMKVSISYGNTVEVKSRNRGLIQSQYPKFSLSVDFEGGNIMERLEEAADAVVQMVEDKLTEIKPIYNMMRNKHE